MNKLYIKVNKYYKTINRIMIDKIVHRMDEIADMYFNIRFPEMNPKDRSKNENALMTKRILSNKLCQEASTFDTVLNFVCAVHHFMWIYDNEPNRLFNHWNLSDWMICANRKVDMKWKDTFTIYFRL